MFLELLVSLCCVVPSGDTLDVATVSAQRNAAVAALSPVQSITEAKIERLGTIGLHEVISQFSGVSIKDYGGVGGLKTVSVRNMGASHTAVIYDGIAISDAQNGQVDISRFDLEDIGTVSVSIGQEDDIFSSARHMTSAGTLRIESSRPLFPDAPTQVNARMTFGSFGTYIPYIAIAQKLGSRYALKASAKGTFSNGDYPFLLQNGSLNTLERRLNSDVQSYGGEANFYADWDTKGQLRAKVNLHSSERGLPGSVILYTQNAYERLWDKSLISSLIYDCNLGERWKLHADAGFTSAFNRHIDTDPIYPAPQDSRYTQNEYSFAVRSLYEPAPGWQIALAEDIFCNTLVSNIPECPFPVRLSSISALSAKYNVRNLKVSASLVGTYMTEELAVGAAPSDRIRLSPMIAASWNFHRNFRLRASYKDGFRVPTFNDLYYARVGNVNLKPEVAQQFNLGLTFNGSYAWGSVDITADTYYNVIKDKIVAVPTMFIWKMRNVGEVEMYGADITASAIWKACSWMKIHASVNYSLQYALDVTDPSSKNYRHQIPYTPRHCGSGNLIFETKWLNLSYRMTSSGKRYSKNQNIPANEIPSYADHSLSLNRTFTFGKVHEYNIHLSLEALNLADNNYEIIHYYPMPGRSYRLTLKFKY
jgi:outer membrane receptor protein involved in Fe transport